MIIGGGHPWMEEERGGECSIRSQALDEHFHRNSEIGEGFLLLFGRYAEVDVILMGAQISLKDQFRN